MPSVAYREWLNAPAGLLEDIIEARVFAAAKQTYDHAKSAKDIPDGPIFDALRELDGEFAQEELDGHAATHD